MVTACEGTKVIDFSQGMAGPMASMILADNGADVVKVEPPWGDWARPLPGFAMWNRGKRGIVLDLRDPPARQRARELCTDADVVVHAGRAGAAERLGISSSALFDCNPRLVYCSISGTGESGPGATDRMYEGTLAARVGRMVGLDPLSGAIPNQDRDAPIFTAAPIASYGAAQLAVQGILAALYDRNRHGVGRRVTTSLLQGEAAFLMRQDMPRGGAARVGLPATPRTVHRGIVLCFLTAECADGRHIQMCARQDHHFRNWMTALGMVDVLDDPVYARAPLGIDRLEDIEKLEARVRARMRTKTQAEWMTIFTEQYDIGADPFLTPEEFLRHPEMVDNGRIVNIDDPDRGAVRQVGPLVVMTDTPARIGRPAPRLGEHDVEVVGGDSSARVLATSVDGMQPSNRAPLAGVTIIELAYYVAGPLSTTLLAEMGARIIKVEPPEGDPSRRTGLQNAKFLAGKESIALDLKSERGQEVLRRLIASSDALMHNFRLGVPERLGFGYRDASAINPRLVYLYAGSYGSRGPQAARAAFHSTPNALCGGGSLQAGRGNSPVDDSYSDPGSGLGAATGLMLGLSARERTGNGQYLETTMLTSAGYIHSNDLTLFDGCPERRVPDSGQHGLHALYRLYECSSGWLFLAAWRVPEWCALLTAIDREDWRDDPRFARPEDRLANDQELSAALEVIFTLRPAEDWVARLASLGLSVTVVSQGPLERWFEDHGLLLPADHPAYGPYWQPPAKVGFSNAAARVGGACTNGEHSRAILTELGYSVAEISQLVAEKIVIDNGLSTVGAAAGRG